MKNPKQCIRQFLRERIKKYIPVYRVEKSLVKHIANLEDRMNQIENLPPGNPPQIPLTLSEYDVAKGIVNGTNIYEAYQRGSGLQQGNLGKAIEQCQLYQDARAIAWERSLLSEDNRKNLFLLFYFFLDKLPPGHVIEYGTYKGGNAMFMAYLLKYLYPENYPQMKVYALDTFDGMPKTDKNIDAHNQYDFQDTNYDSLKAEAKEFGLKNIIFVKGMFEDTNAEVMREAKNILLAHIDCDIASAVQFAYEGVKPHMVNGGYIIFDDANISDCIGATRVVEDCLIRRDGLNSEQVWPHYVFRIFNKD